MTTTLAARPSHSPPDPLLADLRIQVAQARESLAKTIPTLAFAKPSADPAVDALLAEFGRRFASAFRYGRVLAIGTHKELIEVGYDPALVAAVLKRWCHQRAYIAAVAKGGPRRALDGSSAGRITEEEQAQASAVLDARKAHLRASRRRTPRKPQRAEPVVVVLNTPRRRSVLDLSREQTR